MIFIEYFGNKKFNEPVEVQHNTNSGRSIYEQA